MTNYCVIWEKNNVHSWANLVVVVKPAFLERLWTVRLLEPGHMSVMSVLGQEQMQRTVEFWWHRWSVEFGFGPFVPFENTSLRNGNPNILRVKEPGTFSPLGLSSTGFISNFYTLKVQSHAFALQSWSFSVAHFGRGETGGCLVFELFEEPSTAVTLQMSTSCSVEISPHIGPLCTFTSTQPHSTPLNFILRRGPLKRPCCSFCERSAANKDSCVRLG